MSTFFERFYSGRKINEHDKNSSGVGLEIVKNLIDLQKGGISVESTHDENGIAGLTRFTITLKCGKKHFSQDEIHKEYKSSEDIINYGKPLAPVIMKEPQEIGTAGDIKDTLDESVLIIEDNEEVRKLVASVFQEKYNIYEAVNGGEGLKIALEKIPDLIVSDIMMPAMDGIELCRKVKKDVNTNPQCSIPSLRAPSLL